MFALTHCSIDMNRKAEKPCFSAIPLYLLPLFPQICPTELFSLSIVMFDRACLPHNFSFHYVSFVSENPSLLSFPFSAILYKCAPPNTSKQFNLSQCSVERICHKLSPLALVNMIPKVLLRLPNPNFLYLCCV